ncbi:MAG: 3'-5' exonuclease [Oxalobacteraceae bacterium]|jgi:DNA polymerase-3 subunit epsilon|nr:3'-5' exonuclease [Oxalobacteraceae bacterium]
MYIQPVVMMDFETTGMSPALGDRVTEVAALRIVGGVVVDRFVSLINCDVRISPFISQLTGITQAMVDRAPPVEQVMPELVRFIGSDALAAHNVSFDEKFLLAESARLGIVPAHAGVICSVKLSRRVFPGLRSYALGALANSLGIRFKGTAHRAEADAEVASALMLHIAAHLGDHYGIREVDPRFLQQINRLTAAKVPAFLQRPPATDNVSVSSPIRRKKSSIG